MARDPDLEAARPTSTGEEELQLQLALAMSKEEHEQQMNRLKGDEVKLQLALEQSRRDQKAAAATSVEVDLFKKMSIDFKKYTAEKSFVLMSLFKVDRFINNTWSDSVIEPKNSWALLMA